MNILKKYKKAFPKLFEWVIILRLLCLCLCVCAHLCLCTGIYNMVYIYLLYILVRYHHNHLCTGQIQKKRLKYFMILWELLLMMMSGIIKPSSLLPNHYNQRQVGYITKDKDNKISTPNYTYSLSLFFSFQKLMLHDDETWSSSSHLYIIIYYTYLNIYIQIVTYHLLKCHMLSCSFIFFCLFVLSLTIIIIIIMMMMMMMIMIIIIIIVISI